LTPTQEAALASHITAHPDLGRVIRDIRRKIAGDETLRRASPTCWPWRCECGSRITASAAPRVYSLHAPEGGVYRQRQSPAPYEFGCKVSIATPATKPKGGQFVLHAKALHGNPFDGHTLTGHHRA